MGMDDREKKISDAFDTLMGVTKNTLYAAFSEQGDIWPTTIRRTLASMQTGNKEPLTMTYAKLTATGTLAYPPAFSTISKLFATSRYRTISSILFNNTSNRHHKDYPYS